jgi:hypothetical protein
MLSKLLRVLIVLTAFSTIFIILIALGAYLYWQRVKQSPQYSLAILVESARVDDREAVARFIDVDAVVDDFMPQVMQKATELYGRNLPPETIKKFSEAVAPIMPSLKNKIREEVPRIIREKTKALEKIPWWAIALGADRVLEIKIEGDLAYVRGKVDGQDVGITLRRSGEIWKVVAVRDDRLAREIAEKIGQDLILMFNREGAKKAAEKLGIKGVEDLLKKMTLP